MSNKKKRNRKASSAPFGSGLPVSAGHTSVISPDDTGQSTVNKAGDSKAARSRFSVFLTYLRTHLLLVGIIGLVAFGALGSALKYLDEEAQREIARRNASKGRLNNRQSESLLNKINPFLPTPTPTPTPQLSKSYIYAGSRLLAVEDANANAAPPADLAIWRPSTGAWWVMAGTGTQQVTQGWGSSGDVPVPGDYDGDGKTDFAVYRPSNNNWYLIYSSSGSTAQFSFGTTGDKAVPADYDGDGKTDVAVFRNSNTTWYISQSSTSTTVSGTYGSSNDIPSPADFDGDGKADLAVFRDSTGHFYFLSSTNLQSQDTTFGTSSDIPVCADYDGDGKADIALWRSSNATWYIKQSSSGSTATVQYGIGTDTPVYNDYDGDGKADIAVWRGVESYSGAGDVGKWYILNSSTSSTRTETWGIANDIPVPAFWKRQ
jgi:hypothetical protein